MKNNSIYGLKRLLGTVNKSSCPSHINLHCHTQFSDGSLLPSQLIEQASINGLKHLSITDHHSINAYPIVYQWLQKNASNFNTFPTIWTGIEISCLLKNCLVHILGLGFKLDSSAIIKYTRGEALIGSDLQAASVIEAIHEAEGLAILAHPARYRLNYKEMINEAYLLDIDGAEAWYDYEHSSPWRPSEYICQTIHTQLQSLNLLSTCGTDTHGLNILSR